MSAVSSPCRIGALQLSFPYALAPLADFTNAPFRDLVADFGGCGLFYSEMLNSRMVAAGSGSAGYLAVGRRDRPLIGQLVGNDPAVMGRAAQRLVAAGFDGIDINMGCARRSIMRHGWGLALMEEQQVALRLISALRKVIGVPLTVKLRSGVRHDEQRLLRFCNQLVDSGVDAICLHPRSGADGFKRPSRWGEIALLAAELAVPVMGSGDVFAPEDAIRMRAQTGCAMVMIGRGALIRPWLLHECATGRRWQGDARPAVEAFGHRLAALLPATVARKRFLQFGNWFSRNWPFHRQLTAALAGCATLEEMVALLCRYMTEHEGEMVARPFSGRL